MFDLTEVERNILVNLTKSEKKAVANQLGITIDTLDVHLHKIRKKRAAAKKLLKDTDPFKKQLYSHRLGE